MPWSYTDVHDLTLKIEIGGWLESTKREYVVSMYQKQNPVTLEFCQTWEHAWFWRFLRCWISFHQLLKRMELSPTALGMLFDHILGVQNWTYVISIQYNLFASLVLHFSVNFYFYHYKILPLYCCGECFIMLVLPVMLAHVDINISSSSP